MANLRRINFLAVMYLVSQVIAASDDSWCVDQNACAMYGKDNCDSFDWINLNCPKLCGHCGNEAATLKIEKVAKYIPATAQPTVNPFKGWEDSPTTVPDTVKVMPANNYTYPKVEYHGTAPLVATNEIANETIYPEISVPVDSSPSYHLYNKTVTSEGLLPVVQATSGSELAFMIRRRR
ncbi:hypothetical protein OS493_006178 [Desmophyllum pertusum]|uniref:ShKT domain-containing protein n=1 Tax=Desmophyllum pertusum TaxID=174260 RepID=A0A9X0DAW7_9CNID|nr:hypothetical protein OS493_006178 [Desmophyllum pertusum]